MPHWSIASVLMCLGLASASPADPPLIEVRVGLLAYEDFREDLQYYDRLFAELARKSDRPVEFRLASGTYGDVLHWLDRGRIDVAIVTPGVFALGMSSDQDGSSRRPYQYVATVTLPPASSSLALDDRRRPGPHDRYRSVCVVANHSPLKTSDDLCRAASAGEARFLFVDPFSVSGWIAPRYALRQLGISPAREQVAMSYSHSNSLRELTGEGAAPEQVAFVWDDALEAVPEIEGRLRRLPFPELDRLWIPADVVLARSDFEHVELVRSLLTSVRPQEFRAISDWSERYGVIQQWNEGLTPPAETPAAQQVSLDELGGLLVHYARSQPRAPRLAVVFSGGGAKCAYQVGAVAALEEQLAQLRQEYTDQGLDIALVVGTSGGAINAVPVAMGISSSQAGRADFRQAWHELDQRAIVRPPQLVRTNIGLWFALVQIGIVLWWAHRRRRAAGPSRRSRGPWFALVTLGIAQITLGYLAWTPWSTLGGNHLVHHAWLWCMFGIRWSAWCLLAVGLLGLVSALVPVRCLDQLRAARRWRAPVFWMGLLGLPLVQVLTVLFYEETLCEGTGIERVLAQRFSALVDGQLKRDGSPPLTLDDRQSDAASLEAISRQIIERRLLKRDLILTGSCLAQSTSELPGDLYFYAAADPSQSHPPLGARGISLAQRPGMLLDVVMGSGSIYPVFPPRRLTGFPRAGQYVDLVDGGFAHNSPIEAAVLWGATHIVLIQASPERRAERRNFLENATAAFQHLYAQAQRVDVQSKEQVTIFTLAPQAPHLCVLDFADNLLDGAIAKGYREARGQRPAGQPGGPSFRKELGEPVFWTPK